MEGMFYTNSENSSTEEKQNTFLIGLVILDKYLIFPGRLSKPICSNPFDNFELQHAFRFRRSMAKCRPMSFTNNFKLQKEAYINLRAPRLWTVSVVCLFVCLFVCFSVCLFVCLFACFNKQLYYTSAAVTQCRKSDLAPLSIKR